MVCIYCGHKTQVINSRSSKKRHTTWRRRQCRECRSVTTTHEEADLRSAIRVKNPNGRLEPFLRDKLFLSVNNALSHRKTALTDSMELTDTIINQLLTLQSGGIVDLEVLKSTSLKIINRFDKAGGVYYKAHYLLG